MSILKQKTLKKEINLSGVGLHSGNNVNIKLVPQRPNTGIYFKRTDLVLNNIIYPSVFNVSSASYCTKISNEFARQTCRETPKMKNTEGRHPQRK